MTFFSKIFYPYLEKWIQFDLRIFFKLGGEKPPTRFRCLKHTSDVVGPKGAKRCQTKQRFWCSNHHGEVGIVPKREGNPPNWNLRVCFFFKLFVFQSIETQHFLRRSLFFRHFRHLKKCNFLLGASRL